MTIRASAIRELADLIVEHAGGRARVAFREEDATDSPSDGASHFLKVDGHRVGKDLPDYGILGDRIEGWPRVLPTIYNEILIPVKAAGLWESYHQAALKLRELVRCVSLPEELPEWDMLLGLSPEPEADED